MLTTRAPSATDRIMARTMAGWERKWTDEQKDAVAIAYEDRKVRPYTLVADLARKGELEHEGRTLEPFDIPPATIRGEVQLLRKRRAGLIGSELAMMPAADAIEDLRRRLINAADAMMRIQERKPVKQRDPEQLRQIARCVREAAAIPQAAREPRKPGTRDKGAMPDGQTDGGLGGAILKSHRNGSQPARRQHEESPSTKAPFERGNEDTTQQQGQGAGHEGQGHTMPTSSTSSGACADDVAMATA